MKHTPAPWQIERRNRSYELSGGDGVFIGDLYRYDEEGKLDQNIKHDATLISRSPNLLLQLKYMIILAHKLVSPSRTHREEAFLLAKETIREAEEEIKRALGVK